MRVFLAGLAGLFALSWVHVAAAENSDMCRFTAGPLAGETQDVSRSGPVGYACSDGVSSTGVFVESGAETDSAESDRPANKHRSGTAYCLFDDGARSGQQEDMPSKRNGDVCTASDGSSGTIRGGRQ